MNTDRAKIEQPPWARPMRGRLDSLVVDSQVLRGNPLGDPSRRPLLVYTPPQYEQSSTARFATLYVIQGMTGQLDMWHNRSAFRPTVIELIDELFAGADPPPPCVVVMVDCWTSYGGSQFLDSPGTGRYHTYLCDEVVPFVDAHYRTEARPERRGISGKSSGGYGAMVTPLLRPDLFGGLASHAGDALFEVCYLPEMRQAARVLRDSYAGAFDAFLDDFRGRPAFSRPHDAELINQWAMAACYSADEDGTVQLPFAPATGALVPEVWERWLAWDPVRMAPRHGDELRSMRGIYIDAGTHDEYYLDLGAEAFRRELDRLGVSEVRFELFDAGHGSIEYRYPLGWRFLAERLAG